MFHLIVIVLYIFVQIIDKHIHYLKPIIKKDPLRKEKLNTNRFVNWNDLQTLIIKHLLLQGMNYNVNSYLYVFSIFGSNWLISKLSEE